MKDDIELLDVNMDEEDRRKSSAKKKPVIKIMHLRIIKPIKRYAEIT